MYDQISTLQLAYTPWPKFAYDLKNTGRTHSQYTSTSDGTLKWAITFKNIITKVTYTDNYYPNTNFNSDPYLIIGNDLQQFRNIFIEIPNLAYSGKLYLYGDDVGNQGYDIQSQFLVYAVSDFDYTTVTYNTQPAELEPIDISNSYLDGNWMVFNFTGLNTKYIEIKAVEGYYANLYSSNNLINQPYLGTSTDSSPTIGSDGTIYIGDWDGKFYAINPDGSHKWTYNAGGNILEASAVIANDGTIYIGTYTQPYPGIGVLHAINTNGTQKWTYDASGSMAGITSSAAIGTDGTIYIGDYNYNLHAINPNGTQKWVLIVSTIGNIYVNMTIASDGNIYVGGTDGILRAIRDDVTHGTPVWLYDAGSEIEVCPAISGTLPNQTVYIGTNYGSLDAINSIDGTPIWSMVIGAPDLYGILSPSLVYIGNNRTVYVTNADGRLHAIDTEGDNDNTSHTIKWSVALGTVMLSTSSSPAIGSDGTIYIGVDNIFYAINPIDGNVRWSYTGGDIFYSSASIGPDGTIYVGNFDGRLYAFNSLPIQWPKFHHDLKNTGRSPFKNISTSGTAKWTFQTTDYINGSPVIGADGTIYIGSNNGNFYAINPDGTTKGGNWPIPIIGSAELCPAITIDNIIYAGYGNELYAINPDGIMKWTSPFIAGDQFEMSSPVIDIDGTIYIGCNDNNLYAIIDSGDHGTIKSGWPYTTGGSINSTPAIGDDGTIYFASGDGYLYAINPDGTSKGGNWPYFGGWSPFPNYSSPVIGSDNTIYISASYYDPDIVTTTSRLYAINPDGTEKWRYELNVNIFGLTTYATSAIGSDGTIYVGHEDGNLYAIIDSGDHGTLKSGMPYVTGGIIDSSPAVDSNNTIYFGNNDGNLYAINSDGTLKWSYLTGSNIFSSSPAIGADGTIYIGSHDGKLYAFKSEVLTCPTYPKYSGDTVTLKATPKDGVGPYYVEFKKETPPTFTVSSSNVPENSDVIYDYILTDLDIASASTGTIDFSVYISDSCPTGSQTCTQLCTINIGCLAPVCNFTVT